MAPGLHGAEILIQISGRGLNFEVLTSHSLGSPAARNHSAQKQIHVCTLPWSVIPIRKCMCGFIEA